jgi:hypothetical protein
VKFFQFLIRVGLSLLIAFIVSFSAALILFNYSGYKVIDRVFLVLAPTLAIAYLLFEMFPTLWKWLGQKQLTILVAFGALAIIGSITVLLPLATAPIYYLGMAAFAVILFALMLPAVSSVERFRAIRSGITHLDFC